MAVLSEPGVFNMYDPTGAFVGGATNVTGFIDLNTMTWGVASITPFFGLNWTASGGTLYGPGTHTVNVNGDGATAGSGDGNVTFTVGAGQLGGNINFAWGASSGIDVFNVWNVVETYDTNGAVTGTTLTSTDIDNNGILGLGMVDGPFPGFSANFNVAAVVDVPWVTAETPPPVEPPPPVVPPAPVIFNVWQDGNLNDISDLIRKVISTDSVKSNTLWRNASDSVDSTVSSFAVFKFGAAANDAGGLFGKFGGFSSSGFDDLGGDGGGFFGKFSGFRSSSVEGSDSVMWRKSGGDGGSGETGGGSLFGGAKSFVAADSQAESSPGFWFNTDGAFPI